jgi:hypothetical protein
MEPRKYVIAKPDGAKTHLLAIDGGVNKFLRIKVILSEINLNLDFSQVDRRNREAVRVLCLSAISQMLRLGFPRRTQARKLIMAGRIELQPDVSW